MFNKLRDPAQRTQAAIRIKAALFGASRERRGLIATILLYFTVINLSLVYIAPILSMLSTSLKYFSDMVNPVSAWIPRALNFDNYTAAMEALNVMPKNLFVQGNTLYENLSRSTMLNTIIMAVPSVLLQLFFCSVAGYAFGRMDFPLKRLLFVLLILEFVVPPQAQLIPMIWTYKAFKFLNTPLVFYVPSLFGHGVRGSLFVFIYMQFFRKLPKEMEEAAMIDGVGPLRIFLKIMMPMAKPAYMVVLLFSLVYHWTESFLSNTLNRLSPTLAVRIMILLDPTSITGNRVAMQTVQMATGVIMMAPILIIYFFTQKTFTESIERTGLVE
jgi:multiple sugar transport system permease protein